MTKRAIPFDTAEFDEAANSPYDEETAPLPILETRGHYLDTEMILLGLGHQLEQLLALGRSIDARLEKLVCQQESEAGKPAAKRIRRAGKR
jgi:hypothetical protein